MASASLYGGLGAFLTVGSRGKAPDGGSGGFAVVEISHNEMQILH